MQLSPLFFLQFSCCLATAMMALMLVLSRLHIRRINRSYEVSRWMMFSALVLLSAHFLLQMLGGYRAESAHMGALINILFYAPAVCMFSYSTVRLATGYRQLRRYLAAAGTSMVLIYGTFFAGWAYYGSLRIQGFIYVMGALFVATVIFFVLAPVREIRRMRRCLEQETMVDLSTYNTFMRAGVMLLCVFAVVLAMAIFYTETLFVLGPLFVLSMLYYVVSFVCLDAHMSAIEDELEDNQIELETEVPDEEGVLSEQYVTRLTKDINGWIANGGYRDCNLNMATMARQLSIPQEDLTQYLQQVHGQTFRIWLSVLRIEAVKAKLLEHDDYKMEAIAEECGFSSRTWLQQKFKAETGLTPTEWKEQQKTSRNATI